MLKKVIRVPYPLVSQSIELGNKFIMDNPYLGMPLFVQIEITSKCNLVCKYCQRTSDPNNKSDNDMTIDSFNMVINQLKYPTRSVHLIGMGEPLLNPDLFSMIRSAKSEWARSELN